MYVLNFCAQDFGVKDIRPMKSVMEARDLDKGLFLSGNFSKEMVLCTEKHSSKSLLAKVHQ